jgi:choline-sulfatase
MRGMFRRSFFLLALCVACAKQETVPRPSAEAPRPSILLVTLDTTRADAIGTNTPSFNRLAAEGTQFRHAYATTPQTLPSHSSMMTGLYPAGHGVHENGRFLAATQNVLAERLRARGYETAAFVSAFALARRFGLARGFDRYDDQFGGTEVERTAAQTNALVLDFLRTRQQKPLFLWVHYYDPHHPYLPPEPYRTRFKTRPYEGEVAAMDEQLGLLVDAFRRSASGPAAIVVAADHGEGLGEHGESQHGNLMYQATMHVPLVIVGPGVRPGASVGEPVSARRIFHTILDWAGIDATHSLRGAADSVVLGEAMKPYFDYGWQPQVMAVEGRYKTIHSGGKSEVYDVIADPQESRDLTASAGVPRASRAAIREYPLPSVSDTVPAPAISEEERRKLAALGYVAATAAPNIRKDAPRPVEMARLFNDLDAAAALFVREEYGPAIPLLQRILAADPHNLDSALRLATAYSALGRAREAGRAFENAAAIAPDSADVWTFYGLHLARGDEWRRAVPMLERVLTMDPDRFPALQALAVLREREGRIGEAVALRQKLYERREATGPELVRLAEMAMELGKTDIAIDAFEKARRLQGSGFAHDLELGVLYLAAHRLEASRDALDRVQRSDRRFAMAAFKRAQVSVLLHEPDAARRIGIANEHADATTRALIARERLFQSYAAR